MSTAITKVLILAADPRDQPRTRLLDELRNIRQCRERATERDRFVLDEVLGLRAEDLIQRMNDASPTVVHYSGHGSGPGGLILQAEGGGSQPVSTDALTGLFKQFAGRLQCVVLNTCLSATQAEAIVPHVPYVVGMTHEIDDAAAVLFSTGFYTALFAGRSYDLAFASGCSAIHFGTPEGGWPSGANARKLSTGGEAIAPVPEHLKPVLYFRPDVYIRCHPDDDPVIDRDLRAPLERAALRVGSDSRFRDGGPGPFVRDAALRATARTFVVWTPSWVGAAGAPPIDFSDRRTRALWWTGARPPEAVPASVVADFCDPNQRVKALADLLAALGLPPETVSKVLAGSAAQGFDALAPLMKSAEVHRAVGQVAASLTSARDNIGHLDRWKQLHDQLHGFTDLFPQLEDSYRALKKAIDVPDETRSQGEQEEAVTAGWEVLLGAANRVLPRFRSLDAYAATPTFEPGEITWLAPLQMAMGKLEGACRNDDLKALRRSVEQLSPVLGQWMTSVNSMLFAIAKLMPLGSLVPALEQIDQTLDQLPPSAETAAQVGDFKRGLVAVRALDGRLRALVATHNYLQTIDSQTAHLDDPEVTAEDIEAVWPRVAAADALLASAAPDEWLQKLRGQIAEVARVICPDAATGDRDAGRKGLSRSRRALISFRGDLAYGFQATDKALKRFCDELQAIRGSLSNALERI